MTCPGSYPTVLNGQISYSDNNTAEYECLTGFYMSGTKRITCTSGVWQTSPTCSVIRQYDEYNVFPDWWFYVLAIILGLLVLACFLCLLLYFCCCRGGASGGGGGGGGCGGGVCSCCCRQRRTGAWEDGVIRVSPQPHGQSNGVYFVPVSQDDLIANQRRPTKNRATNTEKDGGKKKTTATDTDDIGEHDTSDYKTSSYVYGTPRSYDGYAWRDQRGLRAPKAWKESSNLETRSDGDLTDRSLKGPKPAKEVKIWMPHSKPVRNNNTSTK